jgi:hypothetical protein
MKKKLEIFEVENMIVELKAAGVLPATMSTTVERTDTDEIIVRTSTAYPPLDSGIEGVTSPELKTFTAQEIVELHDHNLGNQPPTE